MTVRRTAIFGGTFDPIHNGHIMLANYLASSGIVDDVWVMVSPLNPLKSGKDISDNHSRLQMARVALQNMPHIFVSDFELSLPTPTFTANTLRALSNEFPDRTFSLLIGSDNWLCLDKWKDTSYILSSHPLLVYPRPGYDFSKHTPQATLNALNPEITFLKEAPVAEISSSYIRSRLRQGDDLRGFLPESVASYIKTNNLYESK